MSAAKPFPNVVPDNITALGGQLRKACGELTTSKTKVVGVRDGATWKSPQARPAWDAMLTARASDVTAAYDVLDHAGNVLTSLGKHLADLKAEYDKAVGALGPDPWDRPDADVPQHQPTQIDLQAYSSGLTACNDAADSASLAIILAAQQLASLSDGVTFPGPPPLCPNWAAVVDPSTLTIMPIAPAFGAPNGAVFANGIPIPLAKGQAFESEILARLGISGEMKSLWRPGSGEPWNFPRIRNGELFRGTYPDSRLAGILEIKSGTTSVCASSVQLRLQQALATLLDTSWSLIAAPNTPVDSALIASARESGGGVYSAVPGYEGDGGKVPFYDRATGKYVSLSSEDGTMKVTPLGDDEVNKIPEGVRKSVQDGANSPVTCRGSGNQPPPPPGVLAWAPEPSSVPVTDNEYQFAWDHSKDGKYQGAGGNVPQIPVGGVPVIPLPGPMGVPMPAPVFPVFPEMPEFPIPVFP